MESLTIPEKTSKSYQHSVENEENIEIPNSDITLNNSSDLINVSLQTIIRENSGYQCDLCDFRTQTKKGIRIHKSKMHTKTMETQTEKLQPESHRFTVFAPLRWKGKGVGNSRSWYITNLELLEEIVSVKDFYLFPENREHEEGEFVPADMVIITEEPWTSKWKDKNLRKSILKKVLIEECVDKPEKIANISDFSVKSAQ